MMRDLYSYAKSVRVWLGKTEEVDEGMLWLYMKSALEVCWKRFTVNFCLPFPRSKVPFIIRGPVARDCQGGGWREILPYCLRGLYPRHYEGRSEIFQ
jgi:hypothetical protein